MFKEREVLLVDAVEWLRSSNERFEGGVFTGIPDISDIPELVKIADVSARSAQYIEWFKSVVDDIFRRLPDGQYAVFSQTDAKIIDSSGGLVSWVDKSHLCSSIASSHGCSLMWHKIALNTELPTSTSTNANGLADRSYETHFRPAYTHLLCYGKRIEHPYRVNQFCTPDVIDRGAMTWQKATGIEACVLGVAFLLNVAHSPVLLNPFCGHGTILGVANYFHMRAIGLEILPRRAAQARAKDCGVFLDAMSDTRLLELGITAQNLKDSNRHLVSSLGSDPDTDSSSVSEIAASVDLINTDTGPTVPKTAQMAKRAMRQLIKTHVKEQGGIVGGVGLAPAVLDEAMRTQQWTKCTHFITHKQRLCSQKRASGTLFCGHHQPEAAVAEPLTTDNIGTK